MARAFKIIEYLRPERWYVENPRGHLRLRPFMQRHECYLETVTYCKYSKDGDEYMYPKPTDIWTNYRQWEPRYCSSVSGYCPYVEGRCHPCTAQKGPSRSSLGASGSDTSESVYRVPEELIADLFKAFHYVDVVDSDESESENENDGVWSSVS